MQALIIQRHVRGWLARKHYQRQIHRIVICQSAVRRFLARCQFKKLRVEARSIEHVKTLNKGLENKIISLQQKIEELNKENHSLKNVQLEVVQLKTKLDNFRGLENEIKKLNTVLNDKNKVINTLEESLKVERDEKMELIGEQEKHQLETENERRYWAEETSKLRKELDNMNEIVKTNQQGAEEHSKIRWEQEKLLLINEQDQDRNAYQKLLHDYNCLEQQCEELQKIVNRQHWPTNQGHLRNSSDVSSIAIDENIGITIDSEDIGYGSVRSTLSNASSSQGRLDTIDWRTNETVNQKQQQQPNNPPLEQNLDVSLVLKLQHKLAEVERERNRLRQRLDEIETSPTSEQMETKAQDAYRLTELEMENSGLKKQVRELRISIGAGTNGDLLEQFDAMQAELDRRRDEIVQLRSTLATQMTNMKTITSSHYSEDIGRINEDGELVLAYETQKKINKQLELELQDEKTRYKKHEQEYRGEIEKLRDDNERQQKLLSGNLMKPPSSQMEAYMQHEITRLTSENLELQEKIHAISESCREYKKQARNLAKRLQDAGLLDGSVDREVTKTEQHLPIPRKKEVSYLGMFEFQSGDETLITRNLIIDLKPRTAVTLLPGLPAYILFMCIRHTDYINDEDKLRSLMTSFIIAIKKVIKKRHEDFETNVLWLSNILRNLHNLKQYSGDKTFQGSNTERQNEQCLRNFDLSEYRQVLSDIAVWIYQGIIRSLEDKIQPLIIPAILEHEAIAGMSSNKPAGMRGRSSSVCRDSESPVSVQKAPHSLLLELNNAYKILGFYGVDPEVIFQIFKQLIYFICASSLNNLLLRKDLCHWSKGTQIRYNLSHLETWIKDRRLDEQSLRATLNPIIEAAQLLQARKMDEDVDSICDMCSNLTSQQICKILTLYTPCDEYEPKVQASFIRKVQERLAERQHGQDANTVEQKQLLMDIKFNFAVRFPFNPSTICLEHIEIPDVLNLHMLKKV